MIETFDTTHLYKPQINHAIKLYKSLIINRISFDNGITGSGKTFTACALIRQLNKPFCIICPKISIPTWEKILKQFGLTAQFIINYEKLVRGNTPYYKWISEKEYRQLHNLPEHSEVPLFTTAKFTFPNDWLVVLDESHKTKGVASLSAGLLFNVKRQNYRIHLMSATQATTPLDMRAFGFLLGLHDGSMRGYKQFALEAGAEWVGKWGAQYFDFNNKESVEKFSKVRDEIFNKKQIASRLTREDFGDLFPKLQVVAESYDMGESSRLIQSVYDDMEAELDELEQRCEDYRQHILAVITKARRKAELYKVPTLIEMTRDLIDEGKSVIIFVNYTDTINSLINKLKQEYNENLIGKITGEQSNNQKHHDINEFNADNKRILIVNLAAGCQSINLHDLNGKFPRAALINPCYSAIYIIQSIGRIDRANTKTDAYIRFVLAAKTIEDSVAKKFNNKKFFIDLLNDGDVIPDNLIFKGLGGMPV